MIDAIAYALGGAMVQAAIWFPITFLAMKKQFRLGSLSSAWPQFGSVVVVFTGIKLAGFDGEIETVKGVITFLFVPFFVCAAVLYISPHKEVQ